MRKIRLALLLLTLGIAIPIAALVWRALEGIEIERAVRHQVVADRAFDAMEAELSRFLLAEEARPFEDYAFYSGDPEARSALSHLAHLPFVIGAFQVDPDGSIHTPLVPRRPQRARRRGDWSDVAQNDVAKTVARITRIAGEFWQAESNRAKSPPPPTAFGADVSEPKKAALTRDLDAAKQDPGTTRALGGPLAKQRESASEAGRTNNDTNAYDVLQSFNRAAAERSERKAKVATASPRTQQKAESLAPPSRAADESSAFEDEASLSASATAASASRAAAAPEPAPSRVSAVDTSRAQQESGFRPQPLPIAPYEAGDAAVPQRSDVPLRVSLEPMVGRAAGDNTLILYRTVLVGQQGFRQGLLLDRTQLGATIAGRAIESTELARFTRIDFAPEAQAPPRNGEFAFQHRFAEPFDSLSARMLLSPLPGTGSPTTIYALVSLMSLIGLAGVVAIHRTAGVAVGFAERRNNFVAAVTHELKTPLTAIRMYAEMLRDGLVTKESKRNEYYGTITDESERLSRLIDNVLEFSHLEHGNREMMLNVGSLGDLLGSATEKLRAHTQREGFTIELDVAPNLPPVRYDRDALLQVIYNLVDNAMKYANAAASKRIVLAARYHDGAVRVSVRDFGPGVSARHLKHVFEPFYRGEQELTRNTKGTGIGLALVRELGEKMGAEVAGQNVDGGGFCVSLRFEPAEA